MTENRAYKYCKDSIRKKSTPKYVKKQKTGDFGSDSRTRIYYIIKERAHARYIKRNVSAQKTLTKHKGWKNPIIRR